MSLADAPGPGMPALPLISLPAPARAPYEHRSSDSLRERFLRAGRDAVDDRELLELLLSWSHCPAEARSLAEALLKAFGTAARVLAAPVGRLRTVAGLGPAGACAIKTAEALGIRLARAALPDRIHPAFDGYAKVVDYCRALAGHREVEEFHLLWLNIKNRLIADERHQRGTVNYTPVYPREICIRALEVGATALIIVHAHPSGDPSPSRADIAMTNSIRDAVKLIDVTLHDHIIVTPSDAFSFREKGLI